MLHRSLTRRWARLMCRAALQELPVHQQPDAMLDADPIAAAVSPASLQQESQQRGAPSSAEAPSSRGGPAAPAEGEGAGAGGEEGEEEEPAEEWDPPYVRYLEPTPDDLDLQVFAGW